jgi:hypothetical protein
MMKNIVFLALGVAFLFYGIVAYKTSMPETRNKRIYQAVKKYSPYYLEKRFGGLEIRSKMDKEFKEKPDNMKVFHRLDNLEKEWGKKHLKRNGKILEIYDNTGKLIAKIQLKTPDEESYVHSFYGL